MSTKLKAGTATSGAVIDADTSGILELQTGSTPTTAITIDASQNVGIGTGSPTGKTTINYNANTAYNTGLSVYNANSGSSAVTAFQLTNDAANRAGAYLTSSTCAFYGGTNTFNLGTVESIPFTFLTGNTERMRIDSGGNLLVGTGTGGGFTIYPSYSRAGSTAAIVNHITGSAGGESYFQFQYAGTGIGSIVQNGTTAVLYSTTSDYRLKDDVKPLKNGLSTIEALNPVSFNWIDGRPDDGFIAHEMQAVIPNCITGEKDAVNEDGTPKYQQMDSSGVIPFLVKAIQELNAKVTALETQLGAK